MPVAFGGQHGTGPNGDFLRAALAEEGMEMLTPPSPALDSGNCVVMITATPSAPSFRGPAPRRC